MLNRMADILEVKDPDAKAKLRERVEAALREYQADSDSPRPTPKELRRTFEDLTERYRGLYQGLKKLGPKERAVVERARQDFPLVSPHKDFGIFEALAALEKIGILLRQAQRWVPPVKRGPQENRARWDLVHQLGVIYAKTRRRVRDDGKEEFEMPTRRYSPYLERDYGPFRDFVVAAHEALGFADPERGVDDVIRSVWGGMGKYRRRHR